MALSLRTGTLSILLQLGWGIPGENTLTASVSERPGPMASKASLTAA
jgi:hypothetical protein